ncbi:MAG: hypothetical protein WBA99_18915 [Nodosilinea sp.]
MLASDELIFDGHLIRKAKPESLSHRCLAARKNGLKRVQPTKARLLLANDGFSPPIPAPLAAILGKRT